VFYFALKQAVGPERQVMGATVQGITTSGYDGTIVDIECHLSNNLPNIVIVGSANKAVDESRERIRGAFASSRIMLPRKRIAVNLAPAEIPKADSGFDLAIAVAILLAGGQLGWTPDSSQAFIGELGLDGSTRAVRGIIGKLLTGRTKGIRTFYIPAVNLDQAQLVPRIKLVAVNNLLELFRHLNRSAVLPTLATGRGRLNLAQPTDTEPSVQLSEVVGQELAKRALEIAAAGGHNLLMTGPPGTGKSMLAKALPSILPPLSREEVLEVTHLHSLASQNYERLINRRPFRAPHHSASYAALTGGGYPIRPGEISLAHRGILFLDELPEFNHFTIEALRQPLEDRIISLSRAHAAARFPADFILIATANPCPCGYFGSTKGRRCKCNEFLIKRYQQQLSGPILDRIDLFTSVHEVHHDQLLTRPADPRADQTVRRRIQRARIRQARRYGSSRLNAAMTNQDLKDFALIEPAARLLLNNASRQMHVSARSYMRTVKVARTIADLVASDSITQGHISEALAYRAS
jgi:magnesium chelatase family protein